MTDEELIEELSEMGRHPCRAHLPMGETLRQAADRIEALTAENERLNKSAECLAESRRLAVKDLAVLEGHMRLETGQWRVDYDCAIRDVEHLRDRIEAQAAEIERLRGVIRQAVIDGDVKASPLPPTATLGETE